MARCQGQTVVNRAEGIFIAGQVGLVEGIRDLSLEEDGIGKIKEGVTSVQELFRVMGQRWVS